MKLVTRVATCALFLAALTFNVPASLAQDHHEDPHHDDHGGHPSGYVQHNEWKKGYHMKDADWKRGQPVDYNHYHLNAPPRGYEWRQVDGNYVMAAVATGVIASVVAASVR